MCPYFLRICIEVDWKFSLFKWNVGLPCTKEVSGSCVNEINSSNALPWEGNRRRKSWSEGEGKASSRTLHTLVHTNLSRTIFMLNCVQQSHATAIDSANFSICFLPLFTVTFSQINSKLATITITVQIITSFLFIFRATCTLTTTIAADNGKPLILKNLFTVFSVCSPVDLSFVADAFFCAFQSCNFTDYSALEYGIFVLLFPLALFAERGYRVINGSWNQKFCQLQYRATNIASEWQTQCPQRHLPWKFFNAFHLVLL